MDQQPSTLLSPEGDAELKRLYTDLAHASRRATAFLRTSGMTSAAFLRADSEVTRIVNGSKKSVALPASIGWRSDYGLCGPRNSSGSLAILLASAIICPHGTRHKTRLSRSARQERTV